MGLGMAMGMGIGIGMGMEMEMGASATCGHRVARFMAPTNSVLIVALGTGLLVYLWQHRPLPWPYPYCKIAKCCLSDWLPCCLVATFATFCSLPHAASSSSLLQFCLNYFACLFMVESLISSLVSLATLTTSKMLLQLLRLPLVLATSAPAVAACVATI